ncbi:hypothetical protein CERSUDRAFT_89875 [Gelatoporia subvermispora B]|uniref:G domain-containing protein n=1 Tax=Ceriporiopsis subvermispora (strain B) TaxID=914234 RepID=M2PWU2_CERS8|nr:hypothetical protein CERSUDRAFT_89875 [Gelatoporia subvermispora B]
MQLEYLVGVMGVDGAGKSSMVKLLSNDERIQPGRDLSSLSSRMQPTCPFNVNGKTVALIDTYGIDGNQIDSERLVVRNMESCLKSAEKEGAKRAGVLWLHSVDRDSPTMITVNTMKTLAGLCAARTSPPDLRKVVIVITQWETVSQDIAVESETRLKSEGFKRLLDAGARLERHDGTLDSGLQILSRLLSSDQ